MKKRYLSIMLIILSLVSLLIGAKNITISDLISFLNNDSINVMLISRVAETYSYNTCRNGNEYMWTYNATNQ